MAAYIVKVMIEDTHPPVWRRIAVPEKINYKDLHAILQAAFGWYDAHLHDFSFPDSDFRVVMSKEDMTFGDCVLEGSRLIDEDITEVKWIRYTYDFGDDWRHKITFEKMDPDYTQRYATIIKWKGDNFNEDVGGVYGAEYFMTEEAKEEYGEDYMEPRQAFDLAKANELLACKTFPVRKNKGKSGSGKRGAGPSEPILNREMKQLFREFLKAAMKENDFAFPDEEELKPKKASKNEAMVNKWLDFSDRWAAAMQSAGIPSKPAENGEQAFRDIQEQFSKEGKWEQMTIPGIDMPKENAEPETGETPGKDITAGNCSIRITTGEHTVDENLTAHSEKVLRDFCRYLRLPLEAGTKAIRAAAIADSFHKNPEYLRLSCKREELECLLSMAGLRDARYRIMSTEAVETAIVMGLMECFIRCEKGIWRAELRFACDAKDILARMDGTDLDDYYSKLEEKDLNVLTILSAYGLIRFEDLRKIAKKFAGVKDTATDFERYLYWHLRLQDKIATLTRHLPTEEAAYAALTGLDVQRIGEAMLHFEDSFTLAPFSNELFKAWREHNLFSMDPWGKLLMLAMECSNTESSFPDETVGRLIEECYHLVLSGCNVRELCLYICEHIPVEGVSKHVILWQLAYEAVIETPLPALMRHSRNDFISKADAEETPEMDAFYEYLPAFPSEGIEGHLKADTHLFELAADEAQYIMIALSYSQLSGDVALLDKFIRSHGSSDELLFLKAMAVSESGNPGEARKIINGLIKSHNGPVDDLIAFRDMLPSSGTAKQKQKKAGKAKMGEIKGLLEDFLRSVEDYEAESGSKFGSDYKPYYASEFDSDYEPDYESDHIIQMPVRKESPKIYPNDPCPCGSGKKYKKCCGKNKT